jgi:hypothetical protein
MHLHALGSEGVLVDNNRHLQSGIKYRKPILYLSSISSPLCRHVAFIEVYWNFQKMVAVHSALYFEVIIFLFRIVWEIVS